MQANYYIYSNNIAYNILEKLWSNSPVHSESKNLIGWLRMSLCQILILRFLIAGGITNIVLLFQILQMIVGVFNIVVGIMFLCLDQYWNMYIIAMGPFWLGSMVRLGSHFVSFFWFIQNIKQIWKKKKNAQMFLFVWFCLLVLCSWSRVYSCS